LSNSNRHYVNVMPWAPLPAPNCSTSSCSPTSVADATGSYWGNPKTRTFAELLIDCEENRTLRAVLVGMLREADRGR
jgi:hypothetical protein